MYKQTEPIRCPKCGAIVKVDLYKILTSNPKCYEWTCPNCGEIGNTKHGDIISFENQIGRATSGYIQKTDEHIPDPNSTTTNNSEVVDYGTLTNPKPTACNIPAPKWIQQGWECPKCGAILAPHQCCCPFCSRKENDWITTVGTGTQPLYAEWTNKDSLTPPSGQHTNPCTNTTISSGGDINFPKGNGLTLNQRGDIIDVE